jgi:CMP-N-acetylneuraminic acid synthetase
MKTSKTPLTALVPIKGASERVPGKNLRDFCGRSLMCRVLGILQEVDVVDRIVVNTDSDKVAEKGRSAVLLWMYLKWNHCQKTMNC